MKCSGGERSGGDTLLIRSGGRDGDDDGPWPLEKCLWLEDDCAGDGADERFREPKMDDRDGAERFD